MPSGEYERLLVYIDECGEAERAVDVACRLAAEHGASLLILAAVVVPQLLPVNAHMSEEEEAARGRLARAHATADSYGLSSTKECIMRSRDAAAAVLEGARAFEAQVIVLGVDAILRRGNAVRSLGGTVEHILKHAPCRVLLVASQCARSAAVPAVA